MILAWIRKHDPNFAKEMKEYLFEEDIAGLEQKKH